MRAGHLGRRSPRQRVRPALGCSRPSVLLAPSSPGHTGAERAASLHQSLVWSPISPLAVWVVTATSIIPRVVTGVFIVVASAPVSWEHKTNDPEAIDGAIQTAHHRTTRPCRRA